MVKPLVGYPFSAFLVVKALKPSKARVWVKILIPFCSRHNGCDSWMLILPYMTLIGFYSSPFPDGKIPEQHVIKDNIWIYLVNQSPSNSQPTKDQKSRAARPVVFFQRLRRHGVGHDLVKLHQLRGEGTYGSWNLGDNMIQQNIETHY
jgi:hypothetical protein